MSFNERLKDSIAPLLEAYTEKHNEIEIISFATTDGFAVQSYSRQNNSFDPETMAAASSTLYSVSNAVAQQILSKHFKITFIESEQGNVAFVAVQICDKDFVLAMSANKKMNIANLRLLINRLADEIRSLDFTNAA